MSSLLLLIGVGGFVAQGSSVTGAILKAIVIWLVTFVVGAVVIAIAFAIFLVMLEAGMLG